MLSAILSILIAGFLDRVRGGFPRGRPSWIAHLATYCAGAIMIALASTDPAIVFGGGLLVGELSWRQDNGWRGDWTRGEGKLWQPLRWGVLWALPLLPLAYFEPRLAAYLLAAPLGALAAILIACRLPPVVALDLRYPWGWSELLELPIIGLLVLAAFTL